MFSETEFAYDARAAAMAGAQAAITDDAGALFWNVAGLANVEKSQVSVTHNRWLLDTAVSSLAGVMPLENGRGIGVNCALISLGSFEELDENGRFTGRTLDPYTIDFSAGYAARIAGPAENGQGAIAGTAGAGLEIVSQRMDEGPAANILYLNAGAQFDLNGLVRLGISANNLVIGAHDDYATAANIRIGAGRNFAIGGIHSMTAAIDTKITPDGITSINTGAEYCMSGMLFLRAGYEYQPAMMLPEGSVAGLSGGLGIVFDAARIDYSVSALGMAGNSNILTLTVKL